MAVFSCGIYRKNSLLPVEESAAAGTAILSSRDLNLSARLDRLREAGIDAFKIEGRMKSIYYVSDVTRVYRHCIDAMAEGKTPDRGVLSELENVSHREYSTGFYFNENEALAPTSDSGYIRKFTYLGYVLEKESPGKGGPKKAVVKAMNRIDQGGPLDIIGKQFPDKIIMKYFFEKDGKPIERVRAGDEFTLTWEDDVELENYNILRRKD